MELYNTMKTITHYEYTTFVLGEHPHPLAQYRQITHDLSLAKRWFRGNKKNVKVLTKVLAEWNQRNTLSELTNADSERMYWIDRLAKRSAVELLSTGKVSADTMFKMACMTTEDFSECVKRATILADRLNKTTQGAEQSVNLDTVPADMLK
jgi:hypothetical protein